MFDAMHARKQVTQMMTMMTAQLKQQLRASLQRQSGKLSAADNEKVEASAKGAMDIYPVPEMLDDMVPIYQRHMTKTDVAAITAFYGSPAGQHLVDESSVMMRESMSTVMPKMNARSQAYIAKMMKDLAASAPPASGGDSTAGTAGSAGAAPGTSTPPAASAPSGTTPPK
jgi:hypothetical protein